MKISFYGATGTVTGSKYLFDDGDAQTLIDCGLFQGFKQIRQRNWQPLPLSIKSIKQVVLTHAHIDHTGYLPVLVKHGYGRPIFCSKATRELSEIMLPDAAHLQEEEARYANKHGYSRNTPALPLFTLDDAEKALKLLEPVDFDEAIRLSNKSSATIQPSGHILGAGMIAIEAGGKRVVFSGDLGRMDDPLMPPPTTIEYADALVLESTYGNRLHPDVDPEAELARHIVPVLDRGGVVVVPAFAVGRAQTLLLLLSRLKAKGALGSVPIFLNSPMAVDATRIYQTYRSQHRLTTEECKAACQVATFVNSVEQSKDLNNRKGPLIIVAASGMATGGRVLHHIKAFAPNPVNLILFSGFQAGGTRGATMMAGAESVRIHGTDIPLRAKVANLEALSAHADYNEILQWLGGFKKPPARTYLTHGEPEAADQLRQHIERKYNWNCYVPDYRETVDV